MPSDSLGKKCAAREEHAPNCHGRLFQFERIVFDGLQSPDSPLIDTVRRQLVEVNGMNTFEPALMSTLDVVVLLVTDIDVEDAGNDPAEFLCVDLEGPGL